MPINGVSFSYQEIVAYTKLNELSEDATNSTDNIHPQYLLATTNLTGVTDGTFILKAGDTMTGALTAPSFIAAAGGTGYGVKFFAEGNTLDFIFPDTTTLTFEYIPADDTIDVRTDSAGILRFRQALSFKDGTIYLRTPSQPGQFTDIIAQTGTNLYFFDGAALHLWDVGDNSQKRIVLTNGVLTAV